MVAARSANQVADVAVASELGSLLYSYCSITGPRWRLEAVLRIHALVRRLGITVPRLDRELDALLARAVCPAGLRVPLTDLARRSESDGCGDAAAALFARSWIGSATHGVVTALRLGDRSAARAVRDRVLAASRVHAPMLDELLEWGYLRHSRVSVPFVASLTRVGSEALYRASAPLVAKLVDVVCATAQYERAPTIREIAARLSGRERAQARVQLCRLTLAARGPVAARREARAIRERSHRAAALRIVEGAPAPVSVPRHVEMLDGIEEGGYAIPSILPELRVHGAPSDEILTLAVARQVERLERRLTPATLPRVIHPGASPLERALHDEGVALSPDARRRRRVLIDAARATVRQALREPASVAVDVLDARLRTLVHLGGELATSSIANAIMQSPIGAHTARVVEAWCELDATRAGAYVIEHADELQETRRLLGGVELRGGLPLGFADAYRQAYDHAKEHSYVRRFIDAWRQHRGMEPDARALRWLAHQDVTLEPEELICRLDDAVTGSHLEHLRAVIADIDRELLVRPPRLWARLRSWASWTWHAHLTHARDVVAINPAIVERCAKRFRLESERLAVGDLGMACQTFDVEGATYRVRLLDKRRDLLTYLRFADVPVPSCYRSTARTWSWSDRDTIDAWGDPLTFCFHIEHGRGAVFGPIGFLFGSFAEVGERRAVVLNSLHVRPNTRALRFAILESIEQHFCRALGVQILGIANTHNGRGELPPAYEGRSVQLHRFRALRCPDVGDDICTAVNRWTSSSPMYWRSLDR